MPCFAWVLCLKTRNDADPACVEPSQRAVHISEHHQPIPEGTIFVGKCADRTPAWLQRRDNKQQGRASESNAIAASPSRVRT